METTIKSNLDAENKVYKRIIYQDGVLLERKYIAGQEPVDTILKDPFMLAIEEQSKVDLQNIPGWATWDVTQTLDYIDANVTNLTSAKGVLKAMARLLVALRDKVYPELNSWEIS